MKKSLVIVVIGIPVIIAVVLKFFGENQYEIPVFYEDGVESEMCEINTDGQYYVENLAADTLDMKDKINIVFFNNETTNKVGRELRRLLSTKSESLSYQVYALNEEQIVPDPESGSVNLNFSGEQLTRIANCDLLIPNSGITDNASIFNIIVLIDHKRRIRGYFDSTDPDEFDRLSAETDILNLELEEEI